MSNPTNGTVTVSITFRCDNGELPEFIQRLLGTMDAVTPKRQIRLPDDGPPEEYPDPDTGPEDEEIDFVVETSFR